MLNVVNYKEKIEQRLLQVSFCHYRLVSKLFLSSVICDQLTFKLNLLYRQFIIIIFVLIFYLYVSVFMLFMLQANFSVIYYNLISPS